MQCTELHSSTVSQAFTVKLMEHWGDSGLQDHLNKTALFYGKKRDSMEALSRELLSDHCSWNTPNAGLFYWFKCLNYPDTHSLIYEKARAEKVLLLPGNVFNTTGEPSANVRAAFSTLTDENLREAVTRFSNVLAS